MIRRKSKLLVEGQKFNKLTIVKLDHIEEKQYKKHSFHLEYYLCRCECGQEKIILKNQITGGYVKSCGCLLKSKEKIQKLKEHSTTHGFSKTRLYKLWIGIKTRCYNPKRQGFYLYGGRGIKMCPEWEKDFLSFRKWALNNGYNENAKRGEYTIDRIDVNGDYSPENCRFISIKEQMNNRRKTTFITYKGQTKPMSEWCKEYGIKINTAHKRIKMGWDLDKVFNEPINQKYIRNGKRNKKGGTK